MKPTSRKAKAKTPKAKPEPKTVRKYSVYNAMHLALRADGFEVPAGLGGFLMDKFMGADGSVPILAEEAIEKKFCTSKKGSFSNWRAELIEKRWLEYNHEEAVAIRTIGACTPGKRLRRYLNKEKILHEDLVTTKMLDARDVKLGARVDGLEGFLRSLIEKVDPPYNEEKEARYMGDVGALVDAIETRLIENKLLENRKSKPEHPDYSKSLKN